MQAIRNSSALPEAGDVEGLVLCTHEFGGVDGLVANVTFAVGVYEEKCRGRE